jgi:hypothetical protein
VVAPESKGPEEEVRPAYDIKVIAPYSTIFTPSHVFHARFEEGENSPTVIKFFSKEFGSDDHISIREFFTEVFVYEIYFFHIFPSEEVKFGTNHVQTDNPKDVEPGPIMSELMGTIHASVIASESNLKEKGFHLLLEDITYSLVHTERVIRKFRDGSGWGGRVKVDGDWHEPWLVRLRGYRLMWAKLSRKFGYLLRED